MDGPARQAIGKLIELKYLPPKMARAVLAEAERDHTIYSQVNGAKIKASMRRLGYLG